MSNRLLSEEVRLDLLDALRSRFEHNKYRHEGVAWADVKAKLEQSPEKLWSLHEMERTGGEPDVVICDEKAGQYVFVDCSPESPKGRRSICYDREAQDSRKEHRPKHNAIDMAEEMGVKLLSEEDYHRLQELGPFDTKTSSWVETPADVRERGGALFGDNRYGRTFIYHNGAQSYYAARGFRGKLSL